MVFRIHVYGVAQAALNAFDDLSRFKPETKAKLIAALKDMHSQLDEKEHPSLTGQIKTLLNAAEEDSE